jgi:hypothetical protein
MDENVTTPPADGCTPTHADTPHPLGGDNSQTPHPLTPDDIVDRLRQHIKHPAMRARTHWDGCIDSHPTCALAWALDEVERLQAQVRSQALELLVAHSEALNLYEITTPSKNGTIVTETERLQQQVDHAHALLGSEAMIWLMGGSEHVQSWITSLAPSVHSYWEKYGTVFRQPTVAEQHSADETGVISQQHNDFVDEDWNG